MAVWPIDLPEFEVGMQDERQSGFIRTPMDTGPSKSRRRFSATSRFMSGTMVLDADQRATFDTFYETTISEGADEFDMTDPVDMTTQTFRFLEPPRFRALVGGPSGVALWRLDAMLERLP